MGTSAVVRDARFALEVPGVHVPSAVQYFLSLVLQARFRPRLLCLWSFPAPPRAFRAYQYEPTMLEQVLFDRQVSSLVHKLSAVFLIGIQVPGHIPIGIS